MALLQVKKLKLSIKFCVLLVCALCSLRPSVAQECIELFKLPGSPQKCSPLVQPQEPATSATASTPSPQQQPAPSSEPASNEPSQSPQANPVVHKPSCPTQTNFNFGENDLLAVNLHQLSCLVAQLEPIKAKEALLSATLGYTPIKDRGKLVETVKIGKQILSTYTLGTLLDLTSDNIESIVMIRRYLGARSSEYIAHSFSENIPPEDQIKMIQDAEKQMALNKLIQEMVANGMSQEDAIKLITTPPSNPSAQEAQSSTEAAQPQPQQTELTDEQVREQTYIVLLQLLKLNLSKLKEGQRVYQGITLDIKFKDGSKIEIHLNDVPERDASNLFSSNDKIQNIYRTNNKNYYFVGVQIQPGNIPKHWRAQPILSEGWKKFEGLDRTTINTSSTFVGIKSSQLPENFTGDVFTINRYEFRLLYGYMPYEFTAEPWKDNYGRNWFENLFFSDDE